MRRIKFAGLAFVAAYAIGSIVTAGAFAHDFLASVTGTASAKIMSSQFVETVAGAIECKGLHVTEGGVTTTKAEIVEVTIQHTSCTAFGFGATVSPAHLRFHANGGLVSLLSTVTAKTSGAECLVTFPSAKNQTLATTTYLNVGKEIELVASVKGISSLGTGSFCTYGLESAGVYSGRSLVALTNGGTLKWQ